MARVENMAGIPMAVFEHHDEWPDGAATALNDWRDHFAKMQWSLDEQLPGSAELTLAMRHLQQAWHFLQDAILIHGVK